MQEILKTTLLGTVLTLLDGERQVLAKIAAGTPLFEVLDELLQTVENRASIRMRAAILLCDEDSLRVRHIAAPQLHATLA